MTAEAREVWILACDACGSQLVDDETDRVLVGKSGDAIRELAVDEGWTRHGDEDICATCTCARTGHDRRASVTGTYAYCCRCGETLLGIEAVAPNPAYL